jgi:hypothetical protein
MISIHGDTFVVRRAFILGQSVIVSPLENPRYRQRRNQLTAEAFGFEFRCQLVGNMPRKMIAQSGWSENSLASSTNPSQAPKGRPQYAQRPGCANTRPPLATQGKI